MHATKRICIDSIACQYSPFRLLEDPFRLKWLILYLGIAFECDSPILEVFWTSASPMLLLLAKPLKLVIAFENIILPRYTLAADRVLTWYYLCKTVPVSKRWTCTYRPHNELTRLNAILQPPEFTFDFGSVLMDPDGSY